LTCVMPRALFHENVNPGIFRDFIAIGFITPLTIEPTVWMNFTF
jgi:hypothetical protein